MTTRDGRNWLAFPASIFAGLLFPGSIIPGLIAAFLYLSIQSHAATPQKADQKTLICFGDSITAGYGLDAQDAYPVQLGKLIAAKGFPYKVLNQGVSGNTTKDAVFGVKSIVALHPNVVVLEFGGNDGLRGLQPDITSKNLDTVLTLLQGAHIRVLLVGITLPPNYGADYIQSFSAVFHAAAAKHRVPLMPMLYDGIYTVPGTIQPDGIHPTAKGSRLIAEHMLPLVTPLLQK